MPKSEFERLKNNKVRLSEAERKIVKEMDAQWHPIGQKTISTVWKSKNPQSGKITYVTNTHRCYQTAPTLKGAIGKFHRVVKGTA